MWVGNRGIGRWGGRAEVWKEESGLRLAPWSSELTELTVPALFLYGTERQRNPGNGRSWLNSLTPSRRWESTGSRSLSSLGKTQEQGICHFCSSVLQIRGGLLPRAGVGKLGALGPIRLPPAFTKLATLTGLHASMALLSHQSSHCDRDRETCNASDIYRTALYRNGLQGARR